MPAQCRSLPPTIRLPVSPLEKTDSRRGNLGFREVPTADTHRIRVGGNLRPVPVIDPRRDRRQQSHQYSSHLWLNNYWQLSARSRPSGVSIPTSAVLIKRPFLTDCSYRSMDNGVIQASNRPQMFGYTNREHKRCLHGKETGMHCISALNATYRALLFLFI
jgi:hypothetical protein